MPTKNEMLQLVRYWATEIIHLDFSFFLYGITGSSEWRTREFANRRLNTIRKLIGQQGKSPQQSSRPRKPSQTSMLGLEKFSGKGRKKRRKESGK